MANKKTHKMDRPDSKPITLNENGSHSNVHSRDFFNAKGKAMKKGASSFIWEGKKHSTKSR